MVILLRLLLVCSSSSRVETEFREGSGAGCLESRFQELLRECRAVARAVEVGGGEEEVGELGVSPSCNSSIVVST